MNRERYIRRPSTLNRDWRLIMYLDEPSTASPSGHIKRVVSTNGRGVRGVIAGPNYTLATIHPSRTLEEDGMMIVAAPRMHKALERIAAWDPALSPSEGGLSIVEVIDLAKTAIAMQK